MILSNKTYISLFTIFILISGGHSAKAQPLEIGIHAGSNISSHFNTYLNIENSIRLRRKKTIAINYQAGLILRKGFSPHIRIQMEPSLIMLGAHYEQETAPQEVTLSSDSRTKLLYLQLPLLLQFSTNPQGVTVYGLENPKTTYHFSTGIFGGYLLDANLTEVSGQTTSNNGALIHNLQSYYPEYEGGALFGIGFEYGQRRTMGIETRAYFSLINSDMSTEVPQHIWLSLALYYIF